MCEIAVIAATSHPDPKLIRLHCEATVDRRPDRADVGSANEVRCSVPQN